MIITTSQPGNVPLPSKHGCIVDQNQIRTQQVPLSKVAMAGEEYSKPKEFSDYRAQARSGKVSLCPHCPVNVRIRAPKPLPPTPTSYHPPTRTESVTNHLPPSIPSLEWSRFPLDLDSPLTSVSSTRTPTALVRGRKSATPVDSTPWALIELVVRLMVRCAATCK